MTSKKTTKPESERRPEKPGELRALKILHILESVEDNPDLQIDMRDTWPTLPELSQRYATLLLEEGVSDDLESAKKLNVSDAELQKAIVTLDAALKSIAG